MGDMTKNFNRSEFACKCGCGFDKIDPRVVNMAQTIRDAMGQAIHINSGCRCEKYNRAVGGVANSNHVKGLAADLSCSRGALALFNRVVNLYASGKLPDLQFCQLYIKKNFVHIDCGQTRTNIFAIAA